jgi:hypothetical protein
MTGGVFISYRRDDSGGYAGRIYDRLTSRLGRENVFFDVDTIPPGRDFVDVLSERVGKCDALLAVIGKHWVLSAGSENARRLDDPNDFVRIEIEAALNRDVPVIPVLVGGAAMPHPEDLPDSLKKLIRRQAVEISHARFDSDAERLTEALSQIEEETRGRESDPPQATAGAVTAPLARAEGTSRAPEPSRRFMSAPASETSSRSLVYLAVLGLIVAGVAGLLGALYGLRKPETSADVKPAAPVFAPSVDTSPTKAPPAASTQAGFSPAGGTRLDPPQVGLIEAAAASICESVKDNAGKAANAVIRATVMGELGGLLGKMADAGSTATGAMSHQEFEGLTQEATAIALTGETECRAQLFPKMLDRLGAPSGAVRVNSGNCSIAVNGNASGNSVSCGEPSGQKP